MLSRNCHGGFTIIEMLISVVIVAIVGAGAYFLLHSGALLAQSRNERRAADIAAIANAVQREKIDNRDVFSCASGSIPTAATRMASSSGNYNMAPCLVPLYLDNFPNDPNAPGAHYISASDYDSAYFISQNSASDTVTVTAPFAELGATVSITQ